MGIDSTLTTLLAASFFGLAAPILRAIEEEARQIGLRGKMRGEALRFSDPLQGRARTHERSGLVYHGCLEVLKSHDGRLSATSEATASNGKAKIVDRAVLLERVDGDEELLQELIQVFLEDSSRLRQEIRDAVASGEAERLKIAAHTLKGAVGNFGAKPAVEAAQQLELMGKTGELSSARQALGKLEEALSQLVPALESLRIVPRQESALAISGIRQK